MDGSVAGMAQGHDKLGRLVPGHSEYAAKKRRIAARLEQLITDHDALPSQRQKLAIAAELLDTAERGRSLVTRTRAANAAGRLLRDIPLKPRPPQPDALDKYLAWKPGDE
jgi:hypothetical protein